LILVRLLTHFPVVFLYPGVMGLCGKVVAAQGGGGGTKISDRGRRRRYLRRQSKELSPAARDEDSGEAGCPSAAHGSPRWSRYPPAARGRDLMPEQVDA